MAGCGDNRAKSDGGTPDADGPLDRVDAGDAVDARDAGDATDARDTGDAGDVSDVGDGGVCQMVTFTDPVNNAMLGAADDASGDACANGFQYTVRVAIAGANGASVDLIGTTGAATTTLGTATVTAGQAQFMNVRLAQGNTTLTVRMTGSTTACTTSAMIMVDCSLPIVTIISPLSDTPPFADRAKHLLAANSTQTLKDLNATVAGAQTNVVACTNKLGSARLFAGQMGDPMLTQVGAAVNAVPAIPADNCPTGLSFIARFMGVTLPESNDNPSQTLDRATQISVSLTDAAAPSVTGNSDPTDLWVDSIAPTISERTPTPFCGSMQNAAGTFTTNVTFSSSTAGVTLSVTNNNSPTPVTFGPPTFAAGVVTFTNVAFPPSSNIVLATATEPSGNSTTLVPTTGMPPCLVTVGQAPVVTFVTPTMGSKLCAVGNSANGCLPDSNMAVPGWQNPITVHVTSGGAPLTTGMVTFVINMGTPQVVMLDASGNGTLSTATIPEGMAVPVTVTTNNVMGAGVGTASLTFQVDTLPPAPVTALTAVPLDRRQASFTLGWTAPLDQGQPAVASYDIHVRKLDPGTMNPCIVEVRGVPGPTVPKAATMLESIPVTGLFIETDYCFTVVARDGVGNESPLVPAMGRADFNTTVLTGMATEQFGIWTDGTGDFGSPAAMNGFVNDRLSDLLVGPNSTTLGQNAYMYFGRPGGYGPGPDVTFTGPPNKRFGQAATAAGDLDGDGLTDIAISAPGAIASDVPVIYIFSRKTAPWALNGGWPATLSYTQATYTITADATYGLAAFGQILARVGNVDGTGRDDLAIGSYLYDPAAGANAGRVVIVKGSDTFASITLPDATNSIVIDGEATEYRLGRALQVLPDNTLVVSAPNSTGGAGRLYALRAPYASTFTANNTTSFDVAVFAGGNGQYGTVLSSLGPIGASMGVVSASATGAGGNFVDVHIAPATDGVFAGALGSAAAPSVRFTSATSGNSVGLVNIGIVPGATPGGSLIGGDTVPDLVIAGQTDAVNALYIVNGSGLSALAGTVDLATTMTGVVRIRINKLPPSWLGFGRSSTLVPDLNGDGYADFVVGESTNQAGRAVVFW